LNIFNYWPNKTDDKVEEKEQKLIVGLLNFDKLTTDYEGDKIEENE
jgi:hypothetical protein